VDGVAALALDFGALEVVVVDLAADFAERCFVPVVVGRKHG
jgi:hypothetical protein